MALALADSLSRYPEGNPTDQLERYLNWYQWGDYCTREACFDIGNTTRKALERFQAYRHPASGSIDPETSGNGALMRLSPAVIAGLNLDIPRFQKLITECTKTTHASPESIACSLIMATLLKYLMLGRSFTAAFSAMQDDLSGMLGEVSDKVNRLIRGDFHSVSAAELGHGGYVIDALKSALWAMNKGTSFTEVVCLAINLGGDTDTRGAITGQLAGACYGFNAIPAPQISDLMEKAMIDDIWSRLSTSC